MTLQLRVEAKLQNAMEHLVVGATVDGRNPFRTALKLWLKPLFVGIYRGIIIPGFLRWCKLDFVHPQFGCYPSPEVADCKPGGGKLA